MAEEEREKLHFFLACLAEVDSRRCLEKKGYSSTFDYCRRRLKLSEDESYRRITAARASVLRPQLLSAVSEGRLTLSAVSRIAPHVDRPDAPDLIARAEGKTARQIDEFLAPLRPVGEKRDVIRAVAVSPARPAGSLLAPVELMADFSFRGTFALRAAVDRATELLSHRFPFGGLNDILFEIVTDYLRRYDPLQGTPGRVVPVRGAATIKAAIRRAVWSRDGGRCGYITAEGVRCEARRFIEIDHIVPRALGGRDEIGNLRLLCRAHNDSERRRVLGEGRATSPFPGAATSGNP